jgi:hypothetical protein
MCSLVDCMKKNKLLKHLPNDWRKSRTFILCLYSTGGLPRALETFLEQINAATSEPTDNEVVHSFEE